LRNLFYIRVVLDILLAGGWPTLRPAFGGKGGMGVTCCRSRKISGRDFEIGNFRLKRQEKQRTEKDDPKTSSLRRYREEWANRQLAHAEWKGSPCAGEPFVAQDKAAPFEAQGKQAESLRAVL
jgi:hypothetical protein